MENEKTNSSERSVIINSVDRTLDIIEYVFKAGVPVSVSQISKDLGIYKSTVYRSLATLEARNYVAQDPMSNLYSLGPKIYAFAGVETTNKDQALLKSLMPYMKRLNDKYEDAVSLGVLRRGHDGMYSTPVIAGLESKHSLSIKYDFNSQYECYCSSLGKCLLAFSRNIDTSVFGSHNMVAFTKYTITTREGLEKELAAVRKQGYAVDNEEREFGLYCIGIPVLNNNYAVAAISLSGPTARVRDEHRDEKIEYMKNLSAEITSDLFL